MQTIADTPIIDSASGAVIRTQPAWLRGLRDLLCGDEGATRVCRIALGGFLIGQFLFFGDRHRNYWLALAAAAAFLFVDWKAAWSSARQDVIRRLVLHFLCWMTVRSLLGYGMVDGDSGMLAARWLLGTFLLAVFGVLVWHAARNAPRLDSLGFLAGGAAALAALVSFVASYGILPTHLLGERLKNIFVYGGWNPVSSGLTWGFAAVWLACLGENITSRRHRLFTTGALLVLLLAVFFTRSRGAVLAVLAGYTVLTALRGFRRTLIPWCLLAISLLVFATSGPLVQRVASWQAPTRSIAPEGVISAKPVSELFQRGDSGRFDLYYRALQGFNTPERWIFGIGQWGPEEACCRSLSKLQYHLHSGFFATFVHGGIIGLGLLLALLGMGVHRARALARGGQHTWLVLLTYGCAGLLFDGHTFTSFTSIPQMETLLFAFPLTAAASVWWHQRRERDAPV